MSTQPNSPDLQGPQPHYHPSGAPYAPAGSPAYSAPQTPYGSHGGAPYPPNAQNLYYGPHPGAPLQPPYPVQPLAVQPPSVWPVAIMTFFLGVFGAIPATTRSAKAKAMGVSVGRYWGTFGGIMAGWFLLFLVIAVASASQRASTVMDAQQLQQDIVQHGDFKDAEGKSTPAKDATCVKVSVSDEGAGSYKCMVDFTDNSRQSFTVTVSPDGSWVTN